MKDPDLEFLVNMDNEDLEPLVMSIIKSHKSPRFTEALTLQDTYKKDPRNYKGYIDEVIHELQLYGGNTLANNVRGKRNLAEQARRGASTGIRSTYTAFKAGKLRSSLAKRFQSAQGAVTPKAILLLPLRFGQTIVDATQGVSYRELLRSVCERLRFKAPRRTSVGRMEHFVFNAVLENAVNGMDKTRLAALIREFKPQLKIPIRRQALTATAQAAIASAGFAPYKLAVIVANAAAKQVLGKGLSFGLNSLLTKSVSAFAGPFGIALTTLWSVNSLFLGEAYRVIIPACVHIGYLRLKYENSAGH